MRNANPPLAFRAGGMALIVAVTAWVYAGALNGDFVSDDVQLIVRNPHLSPLTLTNLRTIFTSHTAAVYMPVTMLSFALDRQFFGAGAPGHHAVNILLHALNALLLLSLLRRLGSSFGTALVVALLWALHPVQVESVAWIIERKNVLSTFFFLLAFRSYVDLSDRRRLLGSLLVVGFFLAAVLSKINTAVLPALMLAYDWVFVGRLRARGVGLAAVLLVVGGLVFAAHLSGNQAYYAQYHGNSGAVTLRTSLTVLPRYFGVVYAPIWLRTPPTVPLRSSWLEPAVVASLAIVIALVTIALVLLWRRRWEAFWLAWFGILLAPMTQIVPLPYLMSDRYLYLPLVGLLVPPVEWGRRLGTRFGLGPATLAAIATLAVSGVAALTVARVPIWHDADSLWADWALRVPGMAVDEPSGTEPNPEHRRRLEEAIARGKETAAIANNLGAMAYEAARLDEAVALLERAHRLDPADPTITLNLGRALLRSHRLEEAVSMLDEAVARAPLSYFAQLNLGRAALAQNDLTRARSALERARALVPNPTVAARELAELERRERSAPSGRIAPGVTRP